MSEEEKKTDKLWQTFVPPWALHNIVIYETSVELMHKECKDARNRLRQQLRNDDPAITDTSLLDVTVAYEGTWHH